ncbi:tripartite tricarboxylate transporter TctB family protein [Aquabacter cavernae]|uniref:tripartite tricarboxylate transporter TctB family protein n=1 Tax=Aquabacter cavernae TaxID=2496029 RepID=UPI000F8EB1AA|nr:tripartite tricarboxylate transporter TctB family protein [Aquabacter cavernae]
MQAVLKRLDLHGLALVGFGLLALHDGSRLAGRLAKKTNIDAVGPHGYIELLGIVMLVLGALMLVRRMPRSLGDTLPPIPWRDLAIAFALLVAYAYGIGIIGFTLATFAFLLFSSRHLSARSWLRCGVFSAVTTVSFYVAFVQLSDMALPKGVLWG